MWRYVVDGVNAEEFVIWVSVVMGVSPAILFDVIWGSVEVNEVAEKYVEETLDLLPSELALKNLSSESDKVRSLVRLVLGGGATKIFLPRDEPLVIVTGDPKIPPLARLIAFLISSPKSVADTDLLKEVERLGVMF